MGSLWWEKPRGLWNSGIPGVWRWGQRTFAPTELPLVRVPGGPPTPPARGRCEAGRWEGPASACRHRSRAHTVQQKGGRRGGEGVRGPQSLPEMPHNVTALCWRSSAHGQTRLALDLVSLCFRCGLCKQPTVGFCPLIQPDKFGPLLRALNPFMCKTIADTLRFEYSILFCAYVCLTWWWGVPVFPATFCTDSVVGFVYQSFHFPLNQPQHLKK